MSFVSEPPKLTLENVAVWYRCKECNRCCHSIPVMEKHFSEHHKDKKFILPENLPAGAKDGRIHWKTPSRKGHKLMQRDLASLIGQPAAVGSLESSKVNAETLEIPPRSGQPQSSPNFQTKGQEEDEEASTATSKTEESLEDISSTENGNETPVKPASTDIQVVGKKRRTLSAKGKALAIASNSKTLKIESQMVTRSGKRSSSRTSCNYKIIYNGGTKYRGCIKCPYRVRFDRRGRFEQHVKLHENGSKAVPCGHCGWYVPSTGLNLHIFNSHSELLRRK